MVRSFLAPLIIVSLAVVLFAGPQETGEAIDTQRSSIYDSRGEVRCFCRGGA
jgi:hypothetical protein